MNLRVLYLEKMMRLKHSVHFYFEDKDKIDFKVFLLKNDLTIRDFATKCGISPSYLNALLNGKRALTEELVKVFSENGYKI